MALRFCTTCCDETPFEVAAFDDGLGDDTECACVHCGDAISLGWRVDVAVPGVVPAAA